MTPRRGGYGRNELPQILDQDQISCTEIAVGLIELSWPLARSTRVVYDHGMNPSK